jgi:hypothetical protein
VTFKTGLIVGAAIGYVLGAKAGRERYEQIAGMWTSFTGNERVQTVVDKGKNYVDQTAQRIRGSVSERLHGASETVRESLEQLAPG